MRKYVLYICFFCITPSSLAQGWVENIILNEGERTINVSVADIDNDGALDLLNVGGVEDSFYWFRNLDGEGNFGMRQTIGGLTDAMYVTSGDLDGDGDIDVVGTSPFAPNDRLLWYENLDGKGTFGTANTITTTTQGQYTVVVADIDGDTDNDLVVVSRDDLALAWYENIDGQGAFGPSQVIISDYVTHRGLAIADIDDDNDLDIVAGTNNLNRMSWFENLDGLGNFSAPVEVSSPGIAFLFVDIADIDGDGDNDIVGTSGASDIVAWWENLDGLGTFGTENTITTTLDAPFKIIAADLDNDLDIDVAVTSAPENGVYWFENTNGKGAFSSIATVTNDLNLTITVAAGDIDNDGDVDLVSGSQSDERFAWFEYDPTLSSFQNILLNNITIHPNPTNNLLQITTNGVVLSKITVTDLKGNQVFSTNKHLDSLDVSSYSSGVYLITLEAVKGATAVKRFVKN